MNGLQGSTQSCIIDSLYNAFSCLAPPMRLLQEKTLNLFQSCVPDTSQQANDQDPHKPRIIRRIVSSEDTTTRSLQSVIAPTVSVVDSALEKQRENVNKGFEDLHNKIEKRHALYGRDAKYYHFSDLPTLDDVQALLADPSETVKNAFAIEGENNYIVTNVLVGKGGKKKVYAGIDLSKGEAVAISVITDKSIQISAPLYALLKEGATNSEGETLQNVATIKDLINKETVQYVVQDLYVGGDLIAYLAANIDLSPETRKEFCRQLLVAYRGLDKACIQHRDAKPDNVFVDPETKQVFVGDWDFAYIDNLKEEEQNRNILKAGTSIFFPPEYIKSGSGAISRSWEIYALGNIFYTIATGSYPEFIEKLQNFYSDKTKQETPDPDLVDMFNLAVTAEIFVGEVTPPMEFLFNMMHFDPSSRYQTYDEIEIGFNKIQDQIFRFDPIKTSQELN